MQQNRRQKYSIEGFYVCTSGLDIENLMKTPLIYSVSYFNLEGLSPKKPSMATSPACRPDNGQKHFDKHNHEPGPTRKARPDLQLCRSQPKIFQNRKICRELNNVTLAELPSKLMRQTPALTCSLRVELLLVTTYFVCNSCRSTVV